MLNNPFKIAFLVALVAAEAIRAPHRRRQRVAWREGRLAAQRFRPIDVALDMVAFVGQEILPLLYVLSPWLDFADYRRPAALGWLGAVLFLGVLALLWRAHQDLGRNWSPTLQIAQEHQLVTTGIYRTIRHPIYAALFLWGIAQALLLPNWIAGPAALLLFLPVYLVRVPREEQMMLDQFGDEYRIHAADGASGAAYRPRGLAVSS